MNTDAIKQSMGPVEWAMLIALSIIWGGAFFFGGVAVKELPPFTIVFFRVFLGALTLWAVIALTRTKMPMTRAAWIAFLGMGLLNNAIPFSLIVWGQTQIASGLASILNGTTPFFTVVVAHYLLGDEKLTRLKLAGVVVGFAGVAVMIGPDLLSGLGANLWAQVAILGAALSYAFAGTFGRRFKAMGIAPLATATGQVTASTALLLPVMLLVDAPWTLAQPSPAVIWSLIGFGVVSTALAYILFFRILAAAGAANLSIVTFLIPVSAIVLGALFLNEALELKHFIGMAVIGLGLALIDGRLFRRKCAPVQAAGR